MCGIAALLTGPELPTGGSTTPPPWPHDRAGLERLRDALATITFELVHAVYTDAGVHSAWSSAADAIDASAERLRAAEGAAVGNLADLVAWRIRQDLLGPVAGIRELAGDASAPGVLRGYWQVEMCLRSLGRLEIRGRDSAGLAVMVHFGSISERDAALEGIHDEVLPQRVICPEIGRAHV